MKNDDWTELSWEGLQRAKNMQSLNPLVWNQ